MKMNGLKCALALSCGLLSVHAGAAGAEDLRAGSAFADADHVVYSSPQGGAKEISKATALPLFDYGGPSITSAKVVLLFWGPSFSNASSADQAYATTLQNFRNQFGTTGEYKVITQYSGIQQAKLGSGTADMFDPTTPPTNVTDAIVQGEVTKYLTTHTFNASTIYEVVLPSASYSSSGLSTSCGGPRLSYCAYHGVFASGRNHVRYSIQPYPSCGGCSLSGWTAAQNQEHFICHETREAVTDPDLNAWYDHSGNEADDKCAWTPTPFIGTGGYSYQYEWSNLSKSCVKTR